MREIKFRAWNKQTHQMANWSEIQNLYNWNVFKQVVVHLMQYTGLKDKNGKEIYEGDVVKDLATDMWVGQVVWSGTGFTVTPETPSERDLWDLYERNRLKVIGNIYENPDLLVGDK